MYIHYTRIQVRTLKNNTYFSVCVCVFKKYIYVCIELWDL